METLNDWQRELSLSLIIENASWFYSFFLFIGLSGPAALRLSAFGAKVMAAMQYK